VSVLETLQVDSVLSYLIALVIPALDAIFPVLPSETAVITLGVTTAGSADPRIALLVACAAVGAFLGDNLSYLLGRRFGPAMQRRFFSTPKGARTRDWAQRSLDRYGTQLIVVCRFIPGGRTAVTLTCGLIGYPRRRFVAATAVAAVIWALYAFLIGRLGGHAFEGNVWAGLAVAFGASVAISGVIEVVRRLRARRRGNRDDGQTGSPPDLHPAWTSPAQPSPRLGADPEEGREQRCYEPESRCPTRSRPAGTRSRGSTTTRARSARSTGSQTTAFQWRSSTSSERASGWSSG